MLLAVCGHYWPRLPERLLPLWVVGIMLCNTIMSHIVYSQALYLRSHKEEPFMVQAVLSALIISALTFVLGKYSGANAIVLAVFCQGMVFGLPYATYIFLTKRQKWHASDRESSEDIT
jgi:O-antigen/teichoic acid export membrane protein